MSVSLRVNGVSHVLDVAGTTPLLYVLRNDLGLSGPKFGCGLAQCGACAVLLDGRAVPSCRLPVDRVRGEITTLEGLGDRQRPHPVQEAFLAEQAAQCGYCTNGMIVATAALLAREPAPSDAEIVAALDGHLCRCGTHHRILRAVRRAAASMRAVEGGP